MRSIEVETGLYGALRTFPKLAAESALALVRAARLYQDAIWLAENQPWLAWLFLVSACETAAVQDIKQVAVSANDLLAWNRKLYDICIAAGGQPLADAAAKD